MSCNCTKVEAIRQMGGFVEIGEVTPLTAYFIFIRDLSTGAVYRQYAVSDISGFLEFDMDDNPRFYQPGRSYELWVHVTTATSEEQQDPITISIGSAQYEYDCFQFEVIKLVNGEKETICYTPLQIIKAV